ncbi:MAG TPA: ABC transporter ATP-binding protein [Ktedonobacterales bacterium]|nr:ABC transporter ATP-binding protein [Ktedonobacterales bacterium]
MRIGGNPLELPILSGQPSDSEAAGVIEPASRVLEAPVLEAEHLYKEFPVHRGLPFGHRLAVHAVEDVSLRLRPGRVTALVGESGSGKTTVARLLAGVYAPTSGTIRLQGSPLGGRRSVGLRAYRRKVQLIFQDPFASLNPVHTVRYHLSRPLRVYGHATSDAEATSQIASVLERVSLTPAEHFMGKYPHELSGGQRQRVAIARALAARPSVLLADEPVSMLDVSIRLEVLNLLLQLKAEDHLAVLYITHDIASARYFADETLVMYAGQVVEGGPSEAVIQHSQHPYTQLLLDAAPDPDRTASRHAPAVTRGDLPSLVSPPSGCRFRSRCPHAMPVCGESFPSPTYVAQNHWVSCFLYQGGGQHPVPSQPTATYHLEVTHDGNA